MDVLNLVVSEEEGEWVKHHACQEGVSADIAGGEGKKVVVHQG